MIKGFVRVTGDEGQMIIRLSSIKMVKAVSGGRSRIFTKLDQRMPNYYNVSESFEELIKRMGEALEKESSR